MRASATAALDLIPYVATKDVPVRPRPRRRRAAEQRDEVATPDHSITSSALAHDPVGQVPYTQISIERIVGI
jgi:hypothetical protein